jgi:hypothetical protein
MRGGIAPPRLTFDRPTTQVEAWTADTKEIVFSSNRGNARDTPQNFFGLRLWG